MSYQRIERVGDATLYLGDCLDVLASLQENSVHSIVTDPPYGLSFMGQAWDNSVPSVEVWRECLRVLKPGGHLLAFAGTRTQHRMAVAIEDAGFEIRDMIAWVYGSGFSKVGYIKQPDGGHVMQGWGGSLKPALEPITMARKPFKSTVAANVHQHGTGALNIDGCRVGTSKETPYGNNPLGRKIHADSWLKKHGHGSGFGPRSQEHSGMNPDIGRWPANLIHDGSDEVLKVFPTTAASSEQVRTDSDNSRNIYGGGYHHAVGSKKIGYQDPGSAARFFYCAKASKENRGDGNGHPTVKPTDLMSYLVRLVTPPGGTVLDPFAGSGSTLVACADLGFDSIGIEIDDKYFEIARKRITNAYAQGRLFK